MTARRPVRGALRRLLHLLSFVAWPETALYLERPGAAGPAPGHPERLVPHLPPSATERALWGDLWEIYEIYEIYLPMSWM